MISLLVRNGGWLKIKGEALTEIAFYKVYTRTAL